MYLLVGLLTFSSVTFSYEKANTCEAVSIGVFVGASLLLGCALLGTYYIANPEAQEDLKESLTNYKDMTEEGMKATYEMNKKIFNDFCDYALAHDGGSAAVYTADGRSYSVKEMQEYGFPEFDDWDKEMKKQGSPSGGGFGSIWDKLSFGLDLLDFVRGFFNYNAEEDGYKYPYTFYTADSDYIDRTTGDYSYFIESDKFVIYTDGTIESIKHGIQYAFANNTYRSYYNSFRAEDFRLCIVLDSTSASTWDFSKFGRCYLSVYCNVWSGGTLTYSRFSYSDQ